MNVKVKPLRQHDLVNLVEFYAASGIDCALDDAPHDRFADFEKERAARRAAVTETSAPLSPSKPSGAPSLTSRGVPTAPKNAPNFIKAAPSTVQGDGASNEDARMHAQAAGTLEELKEALTAFEGCSLKRTAKNLVFGVGNPDARVMFIGEAPGREEDLTGIPFVGRSGDLLNLMLAAIGLERDSDTYIANVVPWRPPGNRTPTPEETELCRPFILRQIELVQPDLVVPLGGAAAKQLINTTNGILRLRGRSMTCATDKGAFPALATLHPAYLLRQPGQKRLAWQDLLKIKEHLSAGP